MATMDTPHWAQLRQLQESMLRIARNDNVSEDARATAYTWNLTVDNIATELESEWRKARQDNQRGLRRLLRRTA